MKFKYVAVHENNWDRFDDRLVPWALSKSTLLGYEFEYCTVLIGAFLKIAFTPSMFNKRSLYNDCVYC